MKARFNFILMLLLSLISTAQGQTNVIYGYVSDYTGQPPGTRYTISLKLLAPNPRWNGSAITKVDTMPVAVNLTNGYFSVTNLLSGYYQWTISGVNGTAFNKWVYPTTEGRVPLGSLDGGDPNLIPPNPSTNYYTQAQVDALLAEVGTGTNGTSAGGITNGQDGVGFPGLTLTNADGGTPTLSFQRLNDDLDPISATVTYDSIGQLRVSATDIWLDGFTTISSASLGSVTGDFSVIGTVSATAFSGDGSLLTGIVASGTNTTAIEATNLLSGGSSPGKILTATAAGSAWSNAPSGGSFDAAASNSYRGQFTGLVTASAITNRPGLQLVIIGDSLSHEYGNTVPLTGLNWAHYVTERTNQNGMVIVSNAAVGGATVEYAASVTNNLWLQFTNAAIPLSPLLTGVPRVISIFGGMNDDTLPSTADELLAQITNLSDLARAYGYDVVGWSVPIRKTATLETRLKMEQVNRGLRLNSTNLYRFMDAAIIAGGMGDTNVSVDGVHFTASVGLLMAKHFEWLLSQGSGYLPSVSPGWETRLLSTDGLATNVTLRGITRLEGWLYGTYEYCLNLGVRTYATNNSFAVGTDASAIDIGLSVGAGATSYVSSAAIGYNALADTLSIAAGREAYAYSNSAALGYLAKASANSSAFGKGARATNYSVALGDSALATVSSVAMGKAASAQSTGVALGVSSSANESGTAAGWFANGNSFGVAVGREAAGTTNSVAIGYGAIGTGTGVAVGKTTRADVDSVAAGRLSFATNGSVASGLSSAAVHFSQASGKLAKATNYSVAIGDGALALTYSAALGYGAIATTNSTAFGIESYAYNTGTAFGWSSAAGDLGTAFGRDSFATSNSVAIGYLCLADGNANVAIGSQAVVPTNWANTVTLGTGTATVQGALHFRGMPLMLTNGTVVGVSGLHLLTNTIPTAAAIGANTIWTGNYTNALWRISVGPTTNALWTNIVSGP